MRNRALFARAWSPRRAAAPAGAALAVLATLALFASAEAIFFKADGRVAPPTLRDTGLYADATARAVDPRHIAFAPQYPLWTDGALKRRWISLPPGAAVDASDPEDWAFPAGTRVWKEFSFGGRPVETRYIERRADGAWLYATYAWSADGTEALLVSERGKRNAHPLGGGRSHTIPGVADCKACHQGGGRSEILGFSALQLSPDRDAAAPHAEAAGIDLAELVRRGLLVGLPDALVETPPRIPAGSATARAALGYLHGNCGHCHNERGPLRSLGLFLRHAPGTVAPAVRSTAGVPVRKRAPGLSPDAALRVEPQHPERSALLERLASRAPALQMPPLGTELADQEAITLVRRWIAESDRDPHLTPRASSPQKGF